jgi:threonine synthase
VVFFPRDGISERQRRQMTTLHANVYAFAVNGDFDVCQELAKAILNDREYAGEAFGDSDIFTSANSISIGRLLPQAVYPFFAYSRLAAGGHLATEPGGSSGHTGNARPSSAGSMIASIPSGNFGDMMGTVLARAMGLPLDKIVIGVNENREFPEFLRTGTYRVEPSRWSPSTAMIVSHPSNLSRLVEFYGGHLYDRLDPKTRKVAEAGIIDRMPHMEELRSHIHSSSVSNDEHYRTIEQVYRAHGVILDPHGSVGWKALETFTGGNEPDLPAIVYETADPGKFPEDIQKAIGIDPPTPSGIVEQHDMPERVYEIAKPPVLDQAGNKRMSSEQFEEACSKIRSLNIG